MLIAVSMREVVSRIFTKPYDLLGFEKRKRLTVKTGDILLSKIDLVLY